MSGESVEKCRAETAQAPLHYELLMITLDDEQGDAGAAAPAAVPAAGAAVSSGAATASPPAGAAGPAAAQPATAASAAAAQPAEAADAPAGQQGPDSSSLLDQLLAAQQVWYPSTPCRYRACSMPTPTRKWHKIMRCVTAHLNKVLTMSQAALASGHGVALLQQMGLDEATAQALALSMQPQPFDPVDDAADQMDDDYAGELSVSSPCWRRIMMLPNDLRLTTSSTGVCTCRNTLLPRFLTAEHKMLRVAVMICLACARVVL